MSRPSGITTGNAAGAAGGRFSIVATAPLFLRAVLAFLALPGIVGFAVPLWIAWPSNGVLWVGLIPLAPMYRGLILIILGWALTFRSWRLLLYAAAVQLLVAHRVHTFEEPHAERHHREEWHRYRAHTPRWVWPVRDR